jgi:CheY-like chemotaxis protein
MISIVDDDKSVREAESSLIKSLGYATKAFASAEEFLESDRLRDTACLITDVQMLETFFIGSRACEPKAASGGASTSHYLLSYARARW